MSCILEIGDLSHTYDGDPVLREIKLCVSQGHIVSLLGPSGCGKTTLLRLIAGFEKVQRGYIRLQGEEIANPQKHLSPEERKIGFVFQDLALFPHLNVEENISFGIRKRGKEVKLQRVAELVDLVGLKNRARAYPSELSGGEKQRVALARALAPQPELILFDEAFASLDSKLRSTLAREVRRILKETQTSAIFVTHDQSEAFDLSDEAGILHGGSIHQWGPTFELYHRPASRFVANFIGRGAFLPALVLGPRKLETELGPVNSDYDLQLGPGATVDLLLRPEDVIHDDASPLKAEITGRFFRGPYHLYQIKLPKSGREVLSHVPSHHNHQIGEKIGIRLDCEHVVLVKD